MYRALWPTRYSREKLDEIFATIHPYYRAAQYQQTPSMGDLSYFDVNVMPSYQFPTCERCWLAVDAANTETIKGSYSAFVALGFEMTRLKVLNVRRGRWRQDVMRTQLIDFYATVARQTGIIPERVVVERAAGGYGIIDSLSGQLPIEPILPLGSKEERAGSVCYIVNRGQVQLPQDAPWLQAFKDELANFPLAATKDQVDAFVHALSYAARPSEFRPQQTEHIVTLDTLAADSECRLLSDFEAGLGAINGGWND
jgi:predicted phage terminase large subunit-like protein